MITLTLLHSCVHGSWRHEKWENRKHGSLNQHRKNSRGGTKFHSRPCNQKLPLAGKPAAWFPHSSTHSLGWGKTRRLFSFNGEVHPFMTWSLFPRCCPNTEKTDPVSQVGSGHATIYRNSSVCFLPVDTQLVYLPLQTKNTTYVPLHEAKKR